MAVSEADRDELARLAPRARIVTVPTGVDTAYFAPTAVPEKPGRLVFTGSMDWYPNEDAILFFIDRILPAIRRAVPGVSMAVVGRNPTGRMRAVAERAGIRVTGTVEDVRVHVEPAAVYVVPLRVGGGTRLKIFEALAMGKAVLSTTVGAEGLALEPGRQVVLGDGAEALSRELVALLRSPDRRASLGSEGRRLVEECYSWKTVTTTFESGLQDTHRQRRRDRQPVRRSADEEVHHAAEV